MGVNGVVGLAAIVLLSGGLDSTVTLAKAIADGHSVTALSFEYGQKHTRELDSAKNVCKHYGVRHIIMKMDLTSFRSSLIRDDMEIPKGREHIGSDIPDTYVPARNIIMLSAAAGLCESTDSDRIYIGANSVDYSGYPDCRPEFFESFEKMIGVGTKAGVEGHGIKIETPILKMSKADIVRLGMKLKAPLELTWSCYSGGKKACGHCDSCVLRLNGFKEAGFKDSIGYEK